MNGRNIEPTDEPFVLSPVTVGWQDFTHGYPVETYGDRAWEAFAAGYARARADRYAQQATLLDWAHRAFGHLVDVTDPEERRRRFLEEALELHQALGGDEDEAHQLVLYVQNREAGEPAQEIGGVMVTLMVLAQTIGASVPNEEAREVARVLGKDPAFFAAKQAAKMEAGVSHDRRR